MKRRLEPEESTSSIPHEKIPSIQAGSPQAEMAVDSSIDLGERILNLPNELKQKILFSVPLSDRRRLRLVNKAMRNAIDMSVSDVEKIKLQHRPDRLTAYITTFNPENSLIAEHTYKIDSSSLSFLFRWIGVHLKSLEVKTSSCYHCYDSLPIVVGGAFELLNFEDACPHLEELKVESCLLWYNDEILFDYILKYVSKRQLEAVGVHPKPFLRSLSLSYWLHCSCRDEKEQIPWCDRENILKSLQRVLAQGHGLKKLDIDSLLDSDDLPIVALRYPTTLTELTLSDIPGYMSTIVDNCPNLHTVEQLHLDIKHKTVNLCPLATLTNLRVLSVYTYLINLGIYRLIDQCMAAFGDHPFGSDIIRPLPQLTKVSVKIDDSTSLILHGTNSLVTSFYLKMRSYNWYMRSWNELVDQVMKALNSKNAYQDLREITVKTSLLLYSNITVLEEMLKYVTKRQMEAMSDRPKPFLHSLSLVDLSDRNFLKLNEQQAEDALKLLQQILDQCHGLKELDVDSLLQKMDLPVVALRYPTTLTELITERLGKSSEDLRTIIDNCPDLKL